MPLDGVAAEQAEKEATIDREVHDMRKLSSSAVTSRLRSPPPPPPSSSSYSACPQPPSDIEDIIPPLGRSASLLDTLELDERALRDIDALYVALKEQRPLPTVPPVVDIESLVPAPIPLHAYPMSILAVTALSSQLWCEEQTHLSMTLGRRVSPQAQLAMDRGTARHEELEREVHDVVHVEVKCREEEWALRMLNGVVGLHELMLVGKTRELMVIARLQRSEAEQPFWLMGVIDEVERIDNDVMEERRQSADAKELDERSRAEERRDKRQQKDDDQRRLLEEQQRRARELQEAQSIKRHFPALAKEERSAGPEDEEMLAALRSFEEMQEEDERKRAREQALMEEKGREEKRLRLHQRAKDARRQNRERMLLAQDSSSFVISDNKTRAAKGLPSVAQQRTTRMQLSTYKWHQTPPTPSGDVALRPPSTHCVCCCCSLLCAS